LGFRGYHVRGEMSLPAKHMGNKKARLGLPRTSFRSGTTRSVEERWGEDTAGKTEFRMLWQRKFKETDRRKGSTRQEDNREERLFQPIGFLKWGD